MAKSLLESNLNQTLILTLILLIGFLLRVINLSGDAPAGDISRSGVFYVDEGTYAHNVVNKALFGEWFLSDDYNAMSNVPVFSLVQYEMVRALGVGLVQIRAGAIFYSLFSLFLLWFILKSVDSNAAFIALILGSGNYFFIIYNRLALLENLLNLLLVIIAGLLFIYYDKQKPVWLILATFFFCGWLLCQGDNCIFLPSYFDNDLPDKFVMEK